MEPKAIYTRCDGTSGPSQKINKKFFSQFLHSASKRLICVLRMRSKVEMTSRFFHSQVDNTEFSTVTGTTQIY